MASRIRRLVSVSALAVLGLEVAALAQAQSSPCSLLSSSQVGALLGFPVGDGKPMASKSCIWEGTGKMTGRRVFLNLLTPAAFAMGRTPLAGSEKPSVSGIGDDAFFKYFSQPRYEKVKVVDLDVKKGQAVIGVEVWGLPLDEAKEKARTLAVAVVQKL